MKVLFDEVKEIVETLPIAYYAKRRIKMVLERTTKFGTSYYDPCRDEIHIDYKIIERGLISAPETENEDYKETAVRSMVYHELSHAILSPVGDIKLWCDRRELPVEIYNIFEDERIETILKDFYIDVNFKKNLLNIYGGTVPTPKTPKEKFFYLVRFRGYQGTYYAKKVDDIIERYSYLNCNYSVDDTRHYDVDDYISEIADLWRELNTEIKYNHEEELNDLSQDVENTENSIKGKKNSKGFEKNNIEAKENSENGKGDGENSENREGDGENGENSENGEFPFDDEKTSGEPNPHGKGKALRLVTNALDEKFNSLRDNKLTMEIDKIISSFNKKNNTGNGCTSYSGVFNPRNVAREDYRYFDKKVASRGNNPYGTLHLNLFIDNSGSFRQLEKSANVLINSLLEVERKNHNFTFDVAFSNDNIMETDKDNCFVVASGGNALKYEHVLASMKKHKKKNAYVYNIVLHDGFLDYEIELNYGEANGKNPFLPWDTKNTTIIDTGDNKRCLSQITSARVVISPYEKLVKTLGKEVVKALQIAFR